MGKIQFTNIIIDDFSIARQNPFNKYVHFLTHIHTDHLKGLSNTWQYGKIYCSAITKQLISLKYPKLYEHMQELQLQVQHTIKLASTLQVTVTLFDANHCSGATMVLIQGYMGTILYTGDIRFDRKVFQEYTYLYPHNRRNKQFKNCSKQIDYLYLDNTFLHPKFTFPPRQKAIQMLDDFIDNIKSQAQKQNRFVDFYIGMDMNGKEEVLVHLANKFQTFIVISQFRFNTIRAINLDCNLFTTDPKQGFIHVVSKSELKQYTMGKQNSIGIILTGWANTPHYRYKNVYAVPYSLHSSYNELKQFVNSIRPSVLYPIVQSGSRNSSCAIEISGLYQQISYTQILQEFRQEYCSQLSQELQQLTSNIDLQKKIKQRLGLDRSTQQINMQQYGLKTVQIQRPNNCTGFRLNANRDQDQILAMKKTVNELKKKNLARKIINNSKSTYNNSQQTKYNKKNGQQSFYMQIQQNQNQKKQDDQKISSDKIYPIQIQNNKDNENLRNQRVEQTKLNKISMFQKFNQNQNIYQKSNKNRQQSVIQIQQQNEDLSLRRKQNSSSNNSSNNSSLKQSQRISPRLKSKPKQIQTKLKKPIFYVIDDQEQENFKLNNQFQDNQENENSKNKSSVLEYQRRSSIKNLQKQKDPNNQIYFQQRNQICQIEPEISQQSNYTINHQKSNKISQQQKKKLQPIMFQDQHQKKNSFFKSDFWKNRNIPVVKHCKDINIFQIRQQKMKQIQITSQIFNFSKRS